MRKLKIVLVTATAMLSSCDLSQIPGIDKRLSIEDSKAVGAACRHSGRALEDCFALNPQTHQAGVFDGWRDMNDYMLANKIDNVEPEIESSALMELNNQHAKKNGAGHATESDNKEGAEHAAEPDKKEARPSVSAQSKDDLPVSTRQRWELRPIKQAEHNAAAETSATAVPPEKEVKPAEPKPAEPARRPWERKS